MPGLWSTPAGCAIDAPRPAGLAQPAPAHLNLGAARRGALAEQDLSVLRRVVDAFDGRLALDCWVLEPGRAEGAGEGGRYSARAAP
jgi:hypothetical protein